MSGSLDVVRGYLQELGFPLFLHTFLEMVCSAPDPSATRVFFEKYRTDFELNHGNELASIALLLDDPALSAPLGMPASEQRRYRLQVLGQAASTAAGLDQKAIGTLANFNVFANILLNAGAARGLPLPLHGVGVGGRPVADGDGDLAARLLDARMRFRVQMSPLALQMALEYLTRTQSGFLLSILNERLAVVSPASFLRPAAAGSGPLNPNAPGSAWALGGIAQMMTATEDFQSNVVSGLTRAAAAALSLITASGAADVPAAVVPLGPAAELVGDGIMNAAQSMTAGMPSLASLADTAEVALRERSRAQLLALQAVRWAVPGVNYKKSQAQLALQAQAQQQVQSLQLQAASASDPARAAAAAATAQGILTATMGSLNGACVPNRAEVFAGLPETHWLQSGHEKLVQSGFASAPLRLPAAKISSNAFPPVFAYPDYAATAFGRAIASAAASTARASIRRRQLQQPQARAAGSDVASAPAGASTEGCLTQIHSIRVRSQAKAVAAMAAAAAAAAMEDGPASEPVVSQNAATGAAAGGAGSMGAGDAGSASGGRTSVAVSTTNILVNASMAAFPQCVALRVFDSPSSPAAQGAASLAGGPNGSGASGASLLSHLDDENVARVVAAGFGDGSVRVWVRAALEVITELGRGTRGQAGAGVGAAASSVRYIELALETPPSVNSTARSVYAVSLSSCGLYLLTASQDGAARVYCLTPYIRASVLAVASEVEDSGRRVILPPALIRALQPNFDPGNGRQEAFRVSSLPPLPPPSENLVPVGTFPAATAGSPLWTGAFNPFSPGVFAVAGRDRCARIYSTAFDTPQLLCVGHLGDVDCLAWHPNGLTLLTGSIDSTLRLWDAGTGECVRVFAGGMGSHRPTALTVSPSGRFFAVGDSSGAIGIWDIPTGLLIEKYRVHATGCSVHSLAFDALGERVASGDGDGRVCIWNARPGIMRFDSESNSAAIEPLRLPTNVPETIGGPSLLKSCVLTNMGVHAMIFAKEPRAWESSSERGQELIVAGPEF
jgi:WD40 repeat protein